MMQPGAVLVVDDDITLARSLARSLTSLGWRAETAHSGREALEVLGRQSFDALILDYQMPQPDGLTLIEQLREEHSQGSRPLTILLSGHLDVPTTVRAVRLGAYDVVEKPAAPAELDRRLRSGLGQRRAAPEAPADAADTLLGESTPMRALRDQVRNVARFQDLTVLLVGEPGTGKQRVAEAIHALRSAGEPFIRVSCAGIPEHLFETELFGSEPDARGGGRGQHAGLLELAGAGTLFFDEIAALPMSLQPKLHQTLESGVFRRVGGTREIGLRARVISANSPTSSNDGFVRPELYYRLSGFTILCPPLRERVEDIELLAAQFLAQFTEHYPGSPRALTRGAIEALEAYEWPGNVRELRAVVQRAAVLTQEPTLASEEVGIVIRELRAEDELRASSSATSSSHLRLDALHVNEPLRVLERRVIEDAWQTSGCNLSAAARKLGLPRTTLRDRLRKYGLR